MVVKGGKGRLPAAGIPSYFSKSLRGPSLASSDEAHIFSPFALYLPFLSLAAMTFAKLYQVSLISSCTKASLALETPERFRRPLVEIQQSCRRTTERIPHHLGVV